MPFAKKEKRKYSDEDVANALAERHNGASLSAVSAKYNIPKTTLSDKFNQKYPSAAGNYLCFISGYQNIYFFVLRYYINQKLDVLTVFSK